MEFIWMVLIGMTAGWLAGQFMTGKGYGVVGDIIVGVIGALIGGILFERAGIFPGSSLMGSLTRRSHRRNYLLIWLREC